MEVSGQFEDVKPSGLIHSSISFQSTMYKRQDELNKRKAEDRFRCVSRVDFQNPDLIE
jgi:hypothetical protein